MTQLNESIEKNCVVLDTQPLVALALQQRQDREVSSTRLTKKDVKKAYRTMILKYHPDKNQDCDTSRIFTTIQAAYERLLIETESESETETEGGGLHSRFSAGSSHRRTRQQQQHAPAPKPKPKPTASRPPRDEDYYSSQYARCNPFPILLMI